MTTTPFTPTDVAQLNKPRGRKPKVIDATPEPDLDQHQIDNAMVAMRDEAQALALAENQHQARVRAVAVQVGYQLPSDCTDPDLIQRDIAVNMRRTAEAMLQVGLGLLVLKEACQHGEFAARLEVLRFEPRVAQKYMQVARRVSNAPSTAHLLKVVESQTKLLELIALDDEELEELALTGETGELKLDDVAGMSVKELRAKVRELKGEVDAKEKLLAHKSEQLDAAALIKTAPPDEVRKQMYQGAAKHFDDTRGALTGNFARAVESLFEHAETTGGPAPLAFVAGQIAQLQADLNALRDRFAIPDVAPALVPEWLSQIEG